MVRLASALRYAGFAILARSSRRGGRSSLPMPCRGATRGQSEETIEVLYLAGARDRFIASQVERRFHSAPD